MSKHDDTHGGARRSGPRSIASVVQDVVAQLGLGRDLDDFRVWEAWEEVVGDGVARNARPIRLDGKRLVVAVKSNTWMQELAMLREEIAARLNTWMGREVVGEIFLVIGRIDEPRRGHATGGRASGPRRASEALDRLHTRLKKD